MDGHELWMRVGPGESCFLRLKKTVNHQRLTLRLRSCASPGRNALDHPGTRINCNAFRVRKNDMAAVRDSLWINGAVPVSQPRPI